MSNRRILLSQLSYHIKYCGVYNGNFQIEGGLETTFQKFLNHDNTAL